MTEPAQNVAGPAYDPADGIAWVNGKYVPIAEASIPILDRGFLRSDVTYDVVHVFDGSFYRLDAHIDRFFRSMEMLRMTIAQRAKLGDLGGAQWVRQRIDAAEHYTGDYTRHPDEIQQPPANA